MLARMSDASARRPADAGLEILLNGEAHRLDGPCTVAELIEQLGLGGRRIAVALNREVVPRSSFGQVGVGADDRVEILQAVGGGV